jgi:hypothetical protein
MADWKSALLQAADNLKLRGNTGLSGKSKPPVKAKTTSATGGVLSSEPHRAGAIAAPKTGPAVTTQPKVAASMIAAPNTQPEKRSLSKAKIPYKPSPAVMPMVTKPTTGKMVPAKNANSDSRNIKAIAQHQKTRPLSSPRSQRPKTRQFVAPEMSKYTICHEQAESKPDQSWQRLGAALAIQPSQRRGKTQCTVGLDFGTAFTKVCVQFREMTYVVRWDLAVPNCTPFLLPGVFTIQPDGTCVLGVAAGGGVCADLKIALLKSHDLSSKINAVIFLALVTRYARAWLFTQYSSVFSGFDIEWFMNVGLPTDPWENPEICDQYRDIALAAWDLGASGDAISVQTAKEVLARTGTAATAAGSMDKVRVQAFPEFVAQIMSYVESAQRRDDLHLLVDVGAGTVDIVVFHVTSVDGDNRYLIHKASVILLGTHILLAYRADACQVVRKSWEENFASLDVRKFESQLSIPSGRLDPVQEYVIDKLFGTMRRLIAATKTYRYETSPAWTEGMPYLLSGGGKNVDVYRSVLSQARTQWPLLEMRLRVPESFASGAIGEPDFHRVSVAHGLSYAADNLGQIERESEVADIRRTRSVREDMSERYIEK